MRFSAPPACPTNLPRDLSASLLFCFALLQQQWLLKSFPSLAALRCFACSVIVTYLPSPRRRPSPKSVQVGRRRRARARDRGACFLLAGGMYVCLCVRRCALRPLLCESVQVGKHAPRSPAGAGAGMHIDPSLYIILRHPNLDSAISPDQHRIPSELRS